MRSVLDKLTLFLGTGAGFGYAPILPGTFGSLWGIAIAWVLQQSELAMSSSAAILAVLFCLGAPICARAAALIGKPDPGAVVYDEYVTLPWVFLVVPLTWQTGLIGFLSFRVFDIVKPWPIKRLERLPGGWGIVADDLGAALLAAVTTWAIHSLIA